MEDKKILDAFDRGTEAGKKLREHMLSATDASTVMHKLGERHKQSLCQLSISEDLHFKLLVNQPRPFIYSNQLKPMTVNELQNAPELIQQIYFCASTNTHISVDQLKEANQKYPKYFIFD